MSDLRSIVSKLINEFRSGTREKEYYSNSDNNKVSSFVSVLENEFRSGIREDHESSSKSNVRGFVSKVENEWKSEIREEEHDSSSNSNVPTSFVSVLENQWRSRTPYDSNYTTSLASRVENMMKSTGGSGSHGHVRGFDSVVDNQINGPQSSSSSSHNAQHIPTEEDHVSNVRGFNWDDDDDDDDDVEQIIWQLIHSSSEKSAGLPEAVSFHKFTLDEVVAATNNFSPYNKITGSVDTYKGKLANGSHEVVIQRGQHGSMFSSLWKLILPLSEITSYCLLQHKNLVGIVGFCDEKDERVLVYEHMKNGSLYDHLHDKNNVEKGSSVLNSWKMRIQIALQAARGIQYLHYYELQSITHGDIKPSNIFLDADWTARVFINPFHHENNKGVGSVGYIIPDEYHNHKVDAKECDVHAFGVVLLELLTGKKAIFEHGDEEVGNKYPTTTTSVIEFAGPVILYGELDKILDSRVGAPELKHEAEALELLASVATDCVKFVRFNKRPYMDMVVIRLEQALDILKEDKFNYFDQLSEMF